MTFFCSAPNNEYEVGDTVGIVGRLEIEEAIGIVTSVRDAFHDEHEPESRYQEISLAVCAEGDPDHLMLITRPKGDKTPKDLLAELFIEEPNQGDQK
jgi:hypothetical protein